MMTDFPKLDRVHAYMGRRAGTPREGNAAQEFDRMCSDNGLSQEEGFLTLAWLTYHSRSLHENSQTPGEYLNALHRPVLEPEAMDLPGYQAGGQETRAWLEALRDALQDLRATAHALRVHRQGTENPTLRDDMVGLEHLAQWWLERLERATEASGQ